MFNLKGNLFLSVKSPEKLVPLDIMEDLIKGPLKLPVHHCNTVPRGLKEASIQTPLCPTEKMKLWRKINYSLISNTQRNNFLNLLKLKQTWIVTTIFWLILHHIEFPLTMNQSEKLFTIWFRLIQQESEIYFSRVQEHMSDNGQ